jgi:hypothetical protein
LLAAGTQRVAFEAIASDAEHQLVTSNPAELADTDHPGAFDDTDATGFVELDAA